MNYFIKIPLFILLMFSLQESYSQDIETNKSKITEVVNGFTFYIHTVEKGQTIYSIKNVYGLTENQIYEYNPEAKDGIKVGQKLKLIKIETFVDMSASPKSKTPSPDKEFINHKIATGETIFGIAKQYNISIDELKIYNAELTENLKIGQSIKIPKNEIAETKNEEILPTNGRIEIKTKDEVETPNRISKTYKIALMMPFYSDAEGEINAENKYYMKEASSYQSFKFIQYYEGFLMAVDSLEKQGFKAEIYVYDTKADSTVTSEIIKMPEFKSLDIIFGPFYKRNLSIVVAEAAKYKIKVISPFSKSSDVERFTNLFVVVPSHEIELTQSIQFLIDSLPKSNISILYGHNPQQMEELFLLKSIIKEYAKAGKIDTNKIHTYDTKSGGLGSIISKLNSNGTNVIISLVTNEAYVSSFISQLNNLSKKYNIMLLGTEIQYNSFKTLEDEYLVNLHLTLSSASFVNYNQAYVQDFAHKFYAEYNTDPEKIAYQGFDQGYYFMSQLLNNGNNFTNKINDLAFEGLQSNFNFSKSAAGAWVNNYINIYQYNNYQLVDKKKILIPYIPLKTNTNEPLLENNENVIEQK